MSQFKPDSQPNDADCQRLLAESEALHQRTLKVQSALFRIAEAAASTEGLQEFYAAVHAIVGELMYAKNFFIAIHDEKSGVLSWPYYVDTSGLPAPAPSPLERFKGGTAHVLRQGSVVHAPRALAEEFFRSGIVSMEDAGNMAEDWLGVPLRVDARTAGVLVVQSYEKGIGYTDSDVEVLNFVAQHIATALSRARAIEGTRQRSAELAVINSVQEGLARELNLQGIVDLVGAKVGEIFQADTVHVRLYDAQRDLAHHDYYMDRGQRISLAERTPPRPSLSAILLDTRQPLLIGTHSESEKLGAVIIQRPDTKEDLNESFLGVPIVAAESVVGAIDVQSYRQHAYGPDDLRLLQTIAHSTAVALENARLFGEVKRRNHELAILTAVQDGLAKQLELQEIVDLVGERVGEIFSADTTVVFLYEAERDWVTHVSYVDRGKRTDFPDGPPFRPGLSARIVDTAQPVVVNTVEEQEALGVVAVESGDAGVDLNQSYLGVPILSEQKVTGVIAVQSYRSHAYGAEDVRLLQTLASSMNIALHNARLFEEVQRSNAQISAALEQERATSDVLRALSTSALDLRTLLETIATNAAKVCGADDAHVYRVDGDQLREWTHRGPIPGLEAGESLPLNRGSLIGRSIIDQHVIHVHDAAAELDEAEYPVSFELQRRWGYHTGLSMPLVRGGSALGGIAIRRKEVRPFTEKEIASLQAFADQAVIAIENARLFEQERQRVAELEVINSIQAGLAERLEFQGIVDLVGDKLREVLQTQDLGIRWFDNKTSRLHHLYEYEHGHRLSDLEPILIEPGTSGPWMTISTSRRPLVLNTRAEMESFGVGTIPGTDDSQSAVWLPIIGHDRVIGEIVVESYEREHAFGEEQLRLLTTVANGVGVALENARLFEELKDRNHEITEALERQTATSEILSAIASSPTDIQPVMDVIAEHAARLSETDHAFIGIAEDKMVHVVAHHGAIPLESSWPFNRDSVTGRSIIEARPVQVIHREPDAETRRALDNSHRSFEDRGLQARHKERNPDSEFPQGDLAAAKYGYRATASVPLMREGKVIGVISMLSIKPKLLDDQQIDLLKSFADQAVIAIENVRLFNELQDRNREIGAALERQTATSEVLAAIAASPTDVQPVLDAVAERAARLCGSYDAAVFRVEGDVFRVAAHWGPLTVSGGGVEQLTPDTVTGSAMLERRTIHVADVRAEPEGTYVQSRKYSLEDEARQRTMLVTPLIREDAVIGAICLRRQEVNPFTEPQVALLKTFADQAAIAIENVRLFAEVQQRNNELAIINRVQEGLSKQLDLQGIVDLIGDKIGRIFKADTTVVGLYDAQHDTYSNMYYVDRGKRTTFPDGPARRPSLGAAVIDRAAPLLLRNKQETRALGAIQVPSGEGEGDLNESFAGVPIMASGKVTGWMMVQSYKQDAYGEDDLRLLQTLSNSVSVALENARLFDETQRLLKQTEQRAAELQIINAVQAGLASKLDMQAIYDLVGDRIREVFEAQAVLIQTYDEGGGTVQRHYGVERDQRFPNANFAMNELHRNIIRRRAVTLFNRNAEEELEALGATVVPGSEPVRSAVFAPLLAGERVVGSISLQDVDREDAYSQADVRLLETLANSMSVALENARLFDEVKQRNSELAIITSVQEGLASKLDFQGIVDLIGRKVGEIFSADTTAVALYDAQRDWRRNAYYVDRGERADLPDGPLPRPSLTARMLDSGQPLLLGTKEETAALGAWQLPSAGTDEDLNESWLGVPILAEKRAIGAIAVQSYQRTAYHQDDLRLLQTLANSVSVALENARLFDETQRLLKETEERNAELAIINSVQEGLARKLDLQGIVELVGTKVGEIFMADTTTVGLYEASRDWWTHGYYADRGQRVPSAEQPGRTTRPSLSAIIVDTRKPVLVGTLEESGRLGAQRVTSEGNERDLNESFLGVPILAGEEVAGGIAIQSYSQNAYGEDDLRLLTTLASAVSVALENARLFDETQRLLKETEERNAELAIINSVQAALAAELKIEGVYEAVGDKVREIFNQADVGIRIYDPDTNLVHFPYAYEAGKRITIDPIQLAERGITRHILESRKPYLQKNAEQARAEFDSRTIPGTLTEQSAVYVPLLVGDRARGILEMVDLEREGAFDESDVRLLQTLANSMSVALENARLFDETQRLLKETEERNAELAIITSVQAALASQLSIEGIYTAVGDKLREIFQNTDMNIRIYDPTTNLMHYPYIVENGKRLALDPTVVTEQGFDAHILGTRQTMVINENMAEVVAKHGSVVIPGTQMEKSSVLVPLVAGQQVRGLINLANMEREHAFSDSDVRLLQTLANSMSVALENARLFDETQRLLKETEERNAQLAIINSVQAALAAELKIEGVYEAVGDKVREIFHQADVGIRIYDSDSNLIHFPYVYEGGKRISIGSRPMTDQSVTRRVLDSREPLLVQTEAEFEAQFGTRIVPGTRAEKSAIYAPLLVADRARGLLEIVDYEHERAFQDSDVRLLQTLANSMSVALENARLFDETQRLLKETEARNAELAIITSVQEGLASKLEMQGIYDLVGEKIREIFDAQAVLVISYDRAANLFHYPYFIEKGIREYPKATPPRGLSAIMLKSRQPVHINRDFQGRYEELTGSPPAAFVGEDPKSWLGVPMVVGDEVRGVISLQNVDREDAYSEADLRLLTTIARTMSVSLENARLFDETQRLLKETEERNAELAVINAVQNGLAAKLDIQGVFDVVGEKLHEVFSDAQVVDILTYDRATELFHPRYVLEKGQRFQVDPWRSRGFRKHIVETAVPLLINRDLAAKMVEFDSPVIIGEPAKSWAGVPMLLNGAVIGVISIQHIDREDAFQDSDVRLLQTIAGSMSVALENARLFDETQRLLKETEQRNAELAIITSVQQGLASKLEMQAIYDLLGEKIGEVFDAQGVAINTYDRSAGLIRSPYLIERGQRHYPEPRTITEVSERWMAMREPMLINENWAQQMEARGLGTAVIPGTDAPKSFLFAPLGSADTVTGTIMLENLDREHAFTQSDVRLLTTLSSSVSVALENARLFDETQRLLKETEQRNAELAIITSVQQGLASKLEMQAIYDLVGDKIREIFEAETIYISVVDPGSGLASFRYFVSLGTRVYDEPPTPPVGFGGHVIKTGKPLLVSEVTQDLMREYGSYLQGNEDEDTVSRSWMGAPIIAGGVGVGCVSIQNRRTGAFDEGDLRLLTTLASSMSVALENARLFDETQRLLKETEERNAELAIINSVQGALSQNLNIEAIYNIVGDKIREIFNAQVLLINSFDEAADRRYSRYIFEKGERFYPEPTPLTDFHHHLIRQRAPLVFNEGVNEELNKLGAQQLPGTEAPLSAVFVPLLAGDRVFGFISLQNVDREHAFGDADVRLLQTLGSSMSVALENARLFDETQRLLKETEERAAELGAINTVSEALVSESELDALIQLIGEQVRQLFSADIAYLALLDPQTQIINFPYSYGDDALRPLRMGEGWTSKIIETTEPLLLNQDLDAAAQRMGAKRVGGTARSYLGVPILVEKQAIGVLSVQSTRQEGRFNEDDQRLLSTIAANAGAAIRNAQLFAETQRRAREMSTLAEIGSDIAATRELEPILERIAAHAGGILNVRDLAIFLLDPDERTLRAPVAIGRNSDELRADVLSIDQGVTGAIARSGVAELVNYPHLDPRVRHVTGTPEDEDPHQAYMAAPLISRGRTIGVIGAWREHVDGLFTQGDLDFLVSVARQTAIAIESARLYLETQRRAREMGALVEVGREISASLDAPTVLQGIARHARDLLNAATSAVFLPQDGGKTFHAIAAVGLDAEETRNYAVTLGKGILGDIARRKVGEIVNDTAHDKRTVVIPGTDAESDEHILAVPLLADKEIQGLMAVWRRGKGSEFATEDLEFLNGLSRQAVIAIQNARLFDDVGRQRQYYEGIVQNSPVAIVTLDERDSIVSWNPAAERLFGYSPEEAIGRNIDDLVANNVAVREEAESRNQQAREGFVRVITKRTRKDGSLVDVALAGVALRLADGRPGSVAIYNDISELQHARQEAVAANEAKSSFLATMSHELRTPMNAVIGMSGLLMDTELTIEQRDYADTIRSSGDALLAIINDILDFSKIEAGRMEVESQPFDLRECLESALDLTAGRAVEKGLDMAYIMDDDVPAGIKGDVTRLRQILINLLSNAVKFTDKGEVVLTVKKGMAEDELLFTVRDTGVGISERQMNRLFQSFSQADSSTTRKFGGTGLGLAISRRLAEMMGGEMHAHSDGPGKGSIFLFTIHAKAAKVAARRTARVVKGVQEALQGKRALIVDDNETNRRILLIQTAKWGMTAREAAKPRDALKWLKDGETFDIILTDMHMPDLDGLMFSREVRRLKERQAIPIVLMSSLGRREAGAEEMDFAAYLTKPLKPSALYDALAGVFARHLAAPREERGKVGIDSQLAARHPLRILLAEDNQVNQKLALRILEQMGYRADVASNGLEAVESIERQAYDVILMDVQMPDMDGLEATRTIRKLADVTQPHIIAMTANAMEGDREMCLAAGMDDYVSKPVRVHELVDALMKARHN